MIQVDDMNEQEVNDLLEEVGYGHLGCAEFNVPYVVPVNFVVEAGAIYLYTTEGKKAEIIENNPNVCLQVEDVKDNSDWRSVVVQGTAVKVTNPSERERAVALLSKTNPTLSPAISVRWMDNWIRENREVVLRIDPDQKTGRRSVLINRAAAKAQPVYATTQPTSKD